MDLLIIAVYCFFLTFILSYSISQFSLALVFIKRKGEREMPGAFAAMAPKPYVTIQLPLFNEKYVAERLIRSVVALEYPKDKLEIQLLDDSTDETVEVVRALVEELQGEGFLIEHIQRPNRVDYKAGALQYGLERCKGEFVAIFDADFLPDPKFLEYSLPHFEKAQVGVVQTRWAHINENYSLLTKLQSYALNAHFTVEQTGRNLNGHFINFNGTAGIWRKECIADAGGWQGDTLTEDLDLSYRAQLRKWKFVFLQDVESPAELPAEMNALKSQQYRWAKGAAECVVKNLKKVFVAPHLTLGTKVNAFFHLMNSFIWVCLLLSGLLLVPFLYVANKQAGYEGFMPFLVVYHFAFFALLLFYTQANATVSLRSGKDYLKFFISYPAFLSLSMGLALHNAIGVFKGYLGIRSAFVRTPKFNILNKRDGIEGKTYVKFKLDFVTVLEVLCFLYFCFGIYYAAMHENYLALPFILMQALGFATVLVYSFLHFRRANGQSSGR